MVQNYQDFEVRAYESLILAETLVEDTYDKTREQGFRRLAGYIFGANKPIANTTPVGLIQEKPIRIAMTAPVGMATNPGGPFLASRWSVRESPNCSSLGEERGYIAGRAGDKKQLNRLVALIDLPRGELEVWRCFRQATPILINDDTLVDDVDSRHWLRFRRSNRYELLRPSCGR